MLRNRVGTPPGRGPIIITARHRGRPLRFCLLFVFCLLLSVVFAGDKFTLSEKLNNERGASLTGFVYDARARRNPFIPLVTADGRLLNLDTEAAKGPLALKGIIYDTKGLSYAIVNNVVVNTGDIIRGYQVLKIEKDRVFLIKEGNISELVFIDKEAK